jgi:hypothetical protein
MGRASIYWRRRTKAVADLLARWEREANQLAISAAGGNVDPVPILLGSRNVEPGKHANQNQNGKTQKQFYNSEPFHLFPFRY